MPLLSLAMEVQMGDKELEPALEEARNVINSFVTPDVGLLADRLRPTTTLANLD